MGGWRPVTPCTAHGESGKPELPTSSPPIGNPVERKARLVVTDISQYATEELAARLEVTGAEVPAAGSDVSSPENRSEIIQLTRRNRVPRITKRFKKANLIRCCFI